MEKAQKAPKNAFIFSCENCAFSCSKKSDWSRHISTRKHEMANDRTLLEQKNAEIESKHICSRCAKVYAARNSLWYHMKKCEKSSNTDSLTRDILTEILRNSQELVKITKESTEITGHTIHHTTNNTTNNAQFNVQFFLNEKCKDAINFTDFINSISLNQEDLQTVVKHGNIEGNTKIIADILEKLGVYRRPIHCMDAKRDTVYIRENDEWEKEDQELPRIKRLANVVSHKVMQQSNVWHEQNPDFMQNEEKKDESLHIMSQVFGSDGGDEKRIIKNVIQQVEVDKIPERRVIKKK